jgi:hypothetical protein
LRLLPPDCSVMRRSKVLMIENSVPQSNETERSGSGASRSAERRERKSNQDERATK